MSQKPNSTLRNFIIAFFVPTIIGKILLLYFGLNYSYYPGEGYGYGLVICLVFSLLMFGRFIYKYWGHEDL